ncbi:MAG TPA: hypothetical protein VGJ79_00165 [Candidatus Dormibacteraeota bacterium]|jgi:hypothetical protein
MPRTRKSASGQPPANQDLPKADEGDAAAMAHVSADELAGSPDVFAAKRSSSSSFDAPAGEETTAQTHASEAQVPAATPEPPSAPSEPIVVPLEPPASRIELPPPPAPVPPPPHVPSPPPVRRSGAGIALGVVLVVVGMFYLVVQIAAVDLSSFGWPLIVIIPGVTLLIVGIISLGSGAAIPGGILTMVGLVLAYQNSTGHWTSWAYAWALVAPGGVGLGLFLQGLRERNSSLVRQGRSLMFIAALIFMVGFVFFESILNISNINDQPVVRAALPALFIVIGLLLLARSISNSRRA